MLFSTGENHTTLMMGFGNYFDKLHIFQMINIYIIQNNQTTMGTQIIDNLIDIEFVFFVMGE